MQQPRVPWSPRRTVAWLRAIVDRLMTRRRRRARFRRALSTVGRFESDRTDISVEHDRELDEIYGS